MCVGDVLERISFEEDEVRSLADRDGAHFILKRQELGRADGRELDGFERREADFDEPARARCGGCSREVKPPSADPYQRR